MRPIDHHSPVPYYYQLADILREEIEAERWATDELIPAEGALDGDFRDQSKRHPKGSRPAGG